MDNFRNSLISGLAFAVVAAGIQSAAMASDALAMKHYQAVTEIRESQWPLWQDEAAEPEALEEALSRLTEALDYLAQPEVNELALGNIFLRFRGYNIKRDMLQIEARLERPQRVAALLRDLRHYAVGPGSHAALIELLSVEVREHPDVKSELEAWRALDRLATGEALKTPFQQDLTVEEKLAGLSRVWTKARQYFVHFDGVPELDWDAAYLQTIETVLATDSTLDYYRELIRFMALLGDSHSNVYPPEELREQFYARPPVRTRLIDGRVFVIYVASERLRERGMEVGSEILTIDGQAVRDYARDQVAPFQSASTEQDLMVRKYSYGLLSGASNSSMRLGLLKPDGTRMTMEIERSGHEDVKWPEPFRRQRFDNIEYLSLDSFAGNDALEAFEAAWPELLKADGLILDLRDNGGGSSWPGFRILAHLIDEPVVPGAYWSRRSDSYRQAAWPSLELHPLPARAIEPVEGERFSGPVVLLTSARTFSAAEDMAMAFSLSQRGAIIGQTTAGSTGQPLVFDLPGGGMARVCAKRDTWPDGSPLIGVGVVPDIEAKPSVEDVRQGRDPEIAAAIKWLRDN